MVAMVATSGGVLCDSIQIHWENNPRSNHALRDEKANCASNRCTSR